ncbi:MAG TPA: hypothetical protein VD948_08205, partial [Rhodothermales bacterium]|nr:hypothetical protein [Rhodothermales bacterium]
ETSFNPYPMRYTLLFLCLLLPVIAYGQDVNYLVATSAGDADGVYELQPTSHNGKPYYKRRLASQPDRYLYFCPANTCQFTDNTTYAFDAWYIGSALNTGGDPSTRMYQQFTSNSTPDGGYTQVGGGLATASASLTPLPVELTTFTAATDASNAVLRWATAAETNNAGFAVEQRAMSGHAGWGEVGFVPGHGTTAEVHSYAYTVRNLHPGRYHFRLRQVDFDGTTSYSPVVEAEVGLTNAYALVPRGPSPFTAETGFSLAVREAQHVTAALYDVQGRRLARLYDAPVAAGQAIEVRVEGTALAPGSYLLRFVGNRFAHTEVVTRMR